MNPNERDLSRVGPFPSGANNLALETSLPRAAFRRAVNVDVSDDGKCSRRGGRTKEFEAVDPHSIFGTGNRGFFAVRDTLFGFTVDGGAVSDPEPLYSGLTLDAPLTYTLIEPDLFVSDGQVNLRIALDGAVDVWSLPAPTPPVMAVTASGSLQPGRYYVATSFKAWSGEEGALTTLELVELDSDGGIELTMPAAPSGAMRTMVYMTKPNGKELLLLAAVPTNVASININKQNLGRPPVTQDMDPMPAGEFSTVWNGRLLVAYDNVVVWSEPNQYGVTKLMYNYLVFSEPVTMLAAIDTAGGFYVGQESKTYFVAGADPGDARLVAAYSAGAIPGTMSMIPGARLPFEEPPVMPVPMWIASNGVFCVGLPDGSVLPLTEARYVTKKAGSGAAMFDQRHGVSRYVATLRNPTDNNFAMTDQITAEVVRNNLPS